MLFRNTPGLFPAVHPDRIVSAERMAELAALARAGDPAANALVESCRAAVRRLARRYAIAAGLECDDVESVGLERFWAAVRNYDPARSKFLTYFVAAATKAMKGFATEEGARKRAECQAETLMAEEVHDPAPDHTGDAGRWAVADAWDWYSVRFTRHLYPTTLAAVRLGDLTTRQVEAWQTALDTTSGEKAKALRALKKLLRDGMERGLIPRNPAAPVEPPIHRRVRGLRVWTADPARAFLAAVAGRKWEAHFRLALDTGMRPAEMLGLHWPAVDLTAGTVRVVEAVQLGRRVERKRKPPKTVAGVRTIPPCPATVTSLACHREKAQAPGGGGLTGPVFGTARTTTESITEWQLKPPIRRAGVPRIALRDLRHTSAALLLAAGVSLRVVADRLGHSDPSVTLRFYVGSLPDQQEFARQAAQTLYG